MSDKINISFQETACDTEIQNQNEEYIELKLLKPASRLNSLFSDEDIISPVSDVAKQARIALQNEYKHSVSKSKTVINATNLFSLNRTRFLR
jgi:hypothetical protein